MISLSLGIPQIIWIVLAFVLIGNHAIHHGQKMNTDIKYNVWIELIVMILYTALLTWGGFFG